MKNLVKLFVVVIVCSMITELNAQSFGVKAGLNLSSLRIEDFDLDKKLNPGFHIGPMIEMPFNEIFSFESGIFLTTKGLRSSEKGGNMEYSNSINMYYIDLPVTAKITQDLGNSKIYGIFGPYIGMGLSGKLKYEITYDGDTESVEEDIEFGSDEDLKRLDYGLTLGAGLEFSSLMLGLSYDFGLANMSTHDEKINSRVLRFSVGYKFGGN